MKWLSFETQTRKSDWQAVSTRYSKRNDLSKSHIRIFECPLTTVPGGGYLVYLSDGDVPFFRVSVRLFFLEQGIKRRQVFWIRLSKHVKRGNFVTTGCYLVDFCVFEYTFY